MSGAMLRTRMRPNRRLSYGYGIGSEGSAHYWGRPEAREPPCQLLRHSGQHVRPASPFFCSPKGGGSEARLHHPMQELLKMTGKTQPLAGTVLIAALLLLG